MARDDDGASRATRSTHRPGRTATDKDIRRTARALLVEHGPEAVTLRAIARSLGITAPALYRYYDSRDDLIEYLRLDVISDLGVELTSEVADLPAHSEPALFTVCRGFRRWALTHTREFTLVFASPTGEVGSARSSVATLKQATEPFGRIFLATAGSLLAARELDTPPDDAVPAELRDDLAAYQAELRAVLTESGMEVPAHRLSLGTTYVMMQFWARLYGHVTLEVFGNYPVQVSKPDALFDAMLASLASEIGLRLS